MSSVSSSSPCGHSVFCGRRLGLFVHSTAHLVASGAVELAQNDAGVRLALPGAMGWDAIDTVLVLR